MTQSDDYTKNQHDIDEVDENTELENNHGDPLTPETIDDDETEVGSNEVQEIKKDKPDSSI